jgi:dihydrodipicolinate synthase/N-acetylneuraminate lyase
MGERIQPHEMIRPRRRVAGLSAVLLPYLDGEVDWHTFRRLIERTLDAKLVPAVNMDTGYVNLLDDATRARVLEIAADLAGVDGFVAGAFVGDEPGAAWAPDRYRQEISLIQEHGGTPVIFPSYGLTERPADEVVAAYVELAAACDRFIAFELGQQFAPFGRIYDLDTYAALVDIPQCIGAKHSSLDRMEELRRLRLRDERRPDFHVYTGNDLAIDMIMYGSDYLLGLSAFAPDVFARRDFCWEIGHPDFYELNDRLQYLGAFAFRRPVPAYKHTAAQFLHLRGWIASPETHPASPTRPSSDVAILRAMAEDLGLLGDDDPGARP